MSLSEFVAGLRRHDVSVAIGLLELLRRASDDGSLDRGEWLAAVRSAHTRALSEVGETMAAGQIVSPGGDQPGDYFDDHILSRLEADGIAAGEPAGEVWERVRLDPAVWSEVVGDRAGVVSALEAAVRALLERGEAAERAPTNGRPADGSTLSAKGLVKVYRKRRVVADVDLSVSQGEIVGLLGPNGAGKTTTFYMIVGLIGPDSGRVYLDDRELTRVPMYKRARRGIGYLAQEPSIFRKLTVEQNILAILQTMSLRRSERKARLEELLDELGLRHLRKARAYSL
jgi:lipopolysaccharide export system ATP-binding protein